MGVGACRATGLLRYLSIFVVPPIYNACCTAAGAYSGQVDEVNEQEKKRRWPGRVQQVLIRPQLDHLPATPIEKKVIAEVAQEESEDG